MPYVDVRLISPTYVPSNPTPNMWWAKTASLMYKSLMGIESTCKMSCKPGHGRQRTPSHLHTSDITEPKKRPYTAKIRRAPVSNGPNDRQRACLYLWTDNDLPGVSDSLAERSASGAEVRCAGPEWLLWRIGAKASLPFIMHNTAPTLDAGAS
jgi:hypothetical protein